MNFLTEIVIVGGLLLATYLLFFFTGGCFSLFCTALNPSLRASDKFRWMLAQTFFPPASLAYLALVEKNRKLQVIGAICLLIAGYYPVHHLMSYPWQTIPVKSQSFAAGFNAVMNKSEAIQKKKEENLQNHKQTKALADQKVQIVGRLDAIKKSSANVSKVLSLVNLHLMLASLSYTSGDLAEEDYAEILNRLDAITSSGALSDKDAQEWLHFSAQVTKESKDRGGSMPQTSSYSLTTQPQTLLRAADQRRKVDFLSKRAEQLSSRLQAMYGVSQEMGQRKVLNDTCVALAGLSNAYVYQKMPENMFNYLLNDLNSKISTGVLSSDDAARWIANAKMAVPQQTGGNP